MKVKELNDVSTTLLKGRITELKCELWFLERGFVVSIPNTPYHYDMLIDVNGKIIKIQVKTSHSVDEEESALQFNLCSMTHNNNGYVRRIYNESDVDYFMTEYKDKFYLVPFKDCGTKAKTLRLKPTKSGQVKGISFANDYLAEKILELEEVTK